MTNKLNPGDTIQCHDPDEAAEVAEQLSREGILWDFCYERDGEKGIWIVIESESEL